MAEYDFETIKTLLHKSIENGLPHFYGEISDYVIIYRGKDKNTTQDNLVGLVGSPGAPLWCKYPSLLRVVRSLFVTIILRRTCHGQSIGKADGIF